MTKLLQGRTAFITGASSGLGAHFARVLSANGACVALTARRTDRLEALAEEIRRTGGRAAVFALDMRRPDDFGPVMDQAEGALGALSILINNAGVGGEGTALDISVEDFDAVMDVNVRGVYFAAREAARRMIANGEAQARRARIVNIASIAAHSVLPGLSAYCVSKAATAMTTRALGREWASRHIAVNAICPGYIETEINRDWFATDGGAKQISRFPRRRLLEAGDLDAALLMLAGPAAAAITGTLITVDDGQSL